MLPLVPIADVDADAVEALLDRAFGTDRLAKTAYRVREGLAPIASLSFAAIGDGGHLAATIQCWPVALHLDAGEQVPMVMVGPIAVDPARQLAGLGQRLTHHALAMADRSALAGAQAQMLVGDPEYYARFFGFSDSPTRDWRLPGPFERRRLLARGMVPTGAGIVVPRVPALA
ncbi:GNAT family N-acetyltransferase [Sphingomonas japonica]|uniref:N-acetyltransferase YhbS n=1 Tax=Sphingomonas japonica TaxID=511662 RepID=A0ABX0U4B2_9SPHN|nr:N-acetyltransferase [Sphingomonas japonica]NIJ24501.1 putative N-acetyltransferase YhbS [Sphingomonas japonica]